MDILFDRNRTQEEFEKILGITPRDLDKKINTDKTDRDNKKNRWISYELKSADVALLVNKSSDDAIDYFYSGLISFSEAIINLLENRYSWATVKFYYSIFYFLRSSLHANKYAIIFGDKYSGLKIADNEHLLNNLSTNTHQSVIDFYSKTFLSDRLLSSTIGSDSEIVYEWYEDARNIVNYRAVSFKEPYQHMFWNKCNEELLNNNIENFLKKIYEDNTFAYTFDEDYAIVSIPFERLKATKYDLINNNIYQNISLERKDYLEKLMSSFKIKFNLYDYLFT